MALLSILDHLSLWEIAHRWYHRDPALSDPLALPLPVQDTLRVLTKALGDCDLHVLNRNGIMYPHHDDVPSKDEYVPRRFQYSADDAEGDFEAMDTSDDLDEDEPSSYADLMDPIELHEEYMGFYTDQVSKHAEYMEPLYDSLEAGQFDRNSYENTHLDRQELLGYCINRRLDPPSFWYTAEEITNAAKLATKDNTAKPTDRRTHAIRDLDRELCRAIAATLWLVDPTMTIENIIKHTAIQQYGNGALYRGRDTLRNWIKDLDPRSAAERTGRPRKKSVVEP